MKLLSGKKPQIVVVIVVAKLARLVAPLVVMAGLFGFACGCSSESNELVIPEADSVPPPSQEPGESPDPSKFKRVKIEK